LASGPQDNGFNSISNNSSGQMMSGGTVPSSQKTTVSSEQEIQGENMNFVYLKAKFSDFPSNFSRVIVSVSTHDQGWADDSHSYSYFDLRIVDQAGKLLAEKQRVICNLREGAYSHKTFTLNRNDKDLGEVMRGQNTLQLIARSQYPGWKVYCKYGEFKFE
jgi:hypothetical protein